MQPREPLLVALQPLIPLILPAMVSLPDERLLAKKQKCPKVLSLHRHKSDQKGGYGDSLTTSFAAGSSVNLPLRRLQ